MLMHYTPSELSNDTEIKVNIVHGFVNTVHINSILNRSTGYEFCHTYTYINTLNDVELFIVCVDICGYKAWKLTAFDDMNASIFCCK